MATATAPAPTRATPTVPPSPPPGPRRGSRRRRGLAPHVRTAWTPWPPRPWSQTRSTNPGCSCRPCRRSPQAKDLAVVLVYRPDPLKPKAPPALMGLFPLQRSRHCTAPRAVVGSGNIIHCFPVLACCTGIRAEGAGHVPRASIVELTTAAPRCWSSTSSPAAGRLTVSLTT